MDNLHRPRRRYMDSSADLEETDVDPGGLTRAGRPLTCKEILRQGPRRWWGVFLVAFIGIGPIWYAIIDRQPPYERVGGTIRPANPKPGEAIEVEWQIKRNRTCRPANYGNLTRQIVDSQNIVWGYTDTPSVFGRTLSASDSPNRIVRTIQLPLGIPPGPAQYQASACFVCDPFRLQTLAPICITEPNIRFNIAHPE